MTQARDRSKLQEDLALLYLRLNGFFVSSFIVHSPAFGKNKTEVDALALRMPYNAEPEREVNCDPLLDLTNPHTDLVICEVKSRGQPLQFNSALYGDTNAALTVLRWTGLFKSCEAVSIADKLSLALAPKSASHEKPPTVCGPRDVRIRGLIFGPEHHGRRPNQPWFIAGDSIFRYLQVCLAPKQPRELCAVTYDFSAWGPHEPIVRYVKSLPPDEVGCMKSLYSFVESEKS